MQIILLERVAKLGQMGQLVKVKDGYARNYLIPQGKALRATKRNLSQFEDRRAQLEMRNIEQKREAEGAAQSVAGRSVAIIRQASESSQLYGSVSARDIADAFAAEGVTLDRRQILLETPIKTLGLHEIPVALHPEVEVTVTVNVARSQDEADVQAGKAPPVAPEEQEAEEEEVPDDVLDLRGLEHG